MPRAADFIKINTASASGSIAGPGQLRAQQRIDHTGFSYIRPSQKGDFRHGGGGEMHQVTCRQHKARQNPHTDSFKCLGRGWQAWREKSSPKCVSYLSTRETAD